MSHKVSCFRPVVPHHFGWISHYMPCSPFFGSGARGSSYSRVYNSNSLFADNFLRFFSAGSLTARCLVDALNASATDCHWTQVGVSGACSRTSVKQKLQVRLRLVYVRSADFPAKRSVWISSELIILSWGKTSILGFRLTLRHDFTLVWICRLHKISTLSQHQGDVCQFNRRRVVSKKLPLV